MENEAKMKCIKLKKNKQVKLKIKIIKWLKLVLLMLGNTIHIVYLLYI